MSLVTIGDRSRALPDERMQPPTLHFLGASDRAHARQPPQLMRVAFATSLSDHEDGMIAFEISIDGQKKCTAGVAELGVVSVIANWVRRAAPDSTLRQPTPATFEEELTLDVGGLMHDPDGAVVHVRWLQQPLSVGQQITLTIVETKHVDPPRARDREDPEWRERKK